MAGLTAEHLRERMHYDHATGVFTWHKQPSGFGPKAGSIAGSFKNSNGYWQVRINKKVYYAHRLAWLYVHGVFPPEVEGKAKYLGSYATPAEAHAAYMAAAKIHFGEFARGA